MPPDAPQPAAPLRVVVVDDEELARLRLRSLLADCVAPAAQVVADFGSASAVLQWLTHQRCDVLLLDIRMPGLDGLQLAERLRGLPDPPAIVFVTAHAEHALAAFDVQALDYLTKPVRRSRLQEALARVAQRRGVERPRPSDDATDALAILVHERGELMRVPVAEVIYLKAEQKYVQLRTATATHWLDESLAELESRLGGRFLRIHRNALVAHRAMAALVRHNELPGVGEGWAVVVAPTGESLAVSRRQFAAVRAVLARNLA